MSNRREVMVQKPLITDGQTDRQTAMVKPVYLHNFVGGGIQTYFQCGEIVEKWPPWWSKFHGGSHFFTTFGSKFNVKIWPVSAFNVEKWPGESFLSWKNDPGSHFSTGSLFNVTPAIALFLQGSVPYLSSYFRCSFKYKKFTRIL